MQPHESGIPWFIQLYFCKSVRCVFTIKSNIDKYLPMDSNSKWKWVIGFSSFMLQFIESGITHSFGVLLPSIIEEFKLSKEDAHITGWISSIQLFFMNFTGIIGGPLLNVFGARNVVLAGSVLNASGCLASAFAPNVYILYFTYGTMTGFGCGFWYITSLVMIQQWFPEHQRALASGIASSGIGVGSAFFGPLLEYLLKHFQYHWTLHITAFIQIIGVLIAILFLPIDDNPVATMETRTERKPICCHGNENSERKGSKKVQTEVLDFTLFKNPVFLLFCTTNSLLSFGYYVPYTYLPTLAMSNGVSSEKAAFLMSILGLSNGTGRVIFGYIGNIGINVRFYMFGLTLLTLGFLNVAISLNNTYPVLVIYSVCFGMCAGCYITLFAVILVDLLGIEIVEKSVGQCLAISSFFIRIGVPTCGFIIDKTGKPLCHLQSLGLLHCLPVLFLCF